MSENKTGRYFKYAIGEIILVVIGILIALQINNWNQNRINSFKEIEYLKGLKSDLEKQIIEFNNSDHFYDSILNISESVLSDFSSTGSLLGIDSINFKLSKIMYIKIYPQINTTFNELNTTGHITLIKKKALRSKIIEYYQNSESFNLRVTGNIQNVFYPQIFPILRSAIMIELENFNISSSVVNSEKLKNKLYPTFESNLNNPANLFEVVNAISARILVATTNKNYINSVHTDANLLLNDINKTLNE